MSSLVALDTFSLQEDRHPDILSILPFPALVFEVSSLLVTQSNRFFNHERNIHLSFILEKFKYNLYTVSDLAEMSELLKTRGSYQIIRTIQQEKESKPYTLNAFNMPDSRKAILYLYQKVDHSKVTDNDIMMRFFVNIDETKLTKSRLTQFLEHLPYGVYRTTSAGDFIYANSAFYTLLGFSSFEELSQISAFSIYDKPHERHKKISDLKLNILNSRESFWITKDRKLLWVKDTFLGILNNHDEIEYIDGFVEDITEKKIKEREIKEKSEFLNEIVSSVYEGIGLIDDRYKIDFCNPPFAKILEISEKKIVGLNILDIIGPLNSLLLKAELANHHTSSFEIKMVKDEKEKFIQIHTTPRIDGQGRYVGAFLTIIDVTERVLMEHELIKARDKAREADRLKTTFLTNLSHEIRTPMNGILGFATLLKSDRLAAQKRNQYVDIVISRGKHLMEILNNIIDITKIEEGHIQVTSGYFSINQLIKELHRIYEAEIGNNDQILSFNYSLHSDIDNFEIYTDSFQLQQVLSHLLNNAIKFTEDGSIEFGYTLQDNDTIRFFVKDTGIGVPKEMQVVIFERFRQVDESFTRLYGGMGLGLAICKGIVDRMGGRIWVESDGKSGSTFNFTIPYTKSQERKTSDKKPKTSESSPWANKMILVVEDDPASFEYLNEVLTSVGCMVSHASNGNIAIELFKSLPKLDLVLLDIQLPEKNGYEIAQTFKELNPSIPIVAQTAHALSEDRKRCFDAGCLDYLTKPIQYDVLLNTLKQYLGQTI